MTDAMFDDFSNASAPPQYSSVSSSYHPPLDPTAPPPTYDDLFGEKPVSQEVHSETTLLQVPSNPSTAAEIPDPHPVTDLNPVENEDVGDCRFNGPISFLRNVAFLCLAICVIVVPFTAIFLPIMLLAFGGVYFHECPGERRLPVSLLVGGVLALLKAVSFVAQLCMSSNLYVYGYHGQLDRILIKPGNCHSDLFYFSYSLIIFLYIFAGLLIIATVYVVKVKQKSANDNTDRGISIV
ncbi:uncharacterized protein LOC128241641 isoform X3 [Mya arenaria]|uniref:uncharacterized protein LOC128241641 isoform X3 n=1 Tax=Mya arenaria TaxID=6604 RepID=UPI0022E0AC4D|nr:uncharacterized protein LOC128241641 isoform X3 [Mya arenaria]